MKRSVMKSRIDMRATIQDKHYLELAAFVAGFKSLTEFMLETAKDRADELFAKSKFEQLSNEDSVLLLKLIEKAPQPNLKLKQAYQNITENYHLTDDKQIVDKISNNLFINPKPTKDVGHFNN